MYNKYKLIVYGVGDKNLTKKNMKNQSNKRNLIWILGIVFVIIIAFIFFHFSEIQKQERENHEVLEELKNETGYIRTIEEEEYEFFETLVIRDLSDNLSDKEMEEKTKEKINRVNAEFLLANQMGLCKPYSFESFQRDMENENSQRKIKKEKNEVFYGPEEFDLISYYNYISGNLKLGMVEYITKNADREVNNGAQAYFEENKEKYRTIEQVEYLLCEEGNVQEKTLLRQDMSSMEKTDSDLFEFLYYGAEGDKFSYSRNEVFREVEIKSIQYETLNYGNYAERVMRDYITNIYLEDLIQNIEEKNLVEFKNY